MQGADLGYHQHMTQSQENLQAMIRQVSDLYTKTAEATAREQEEALGGDSDGENFKVSASSLGKQLCNALFESPRHYRQTYTH
jgi:hypothetical protein